MQTSRMRAKRL